MREHGCGEADSLTKHLESAASASHVIRLHGPWQCELCTSPTVTPRSDSAASHGGSSETLKIKLPVDWSEFFSERTCDSMVWRRSFGCPTNLGRAERVELVITNLRADVRVRWNEVQIEPIARSDAMARFEVTHRLNIRNRLALEVQALLSETPATRARCESGKAAPAGPFGQVYLEILTSG